MHHSTSHLHLSYETKKLDLSPGRRGDANKLDVVLEVGVRRHEALPILRTHAFRTISERRGEEGLHLGTWFHVFHHLFDSRNHLLLPHPERQWLSTLFLCRVKYLAAWQVRRVVKDNVPEIAMVLF